MDLNFSLCPLRPGEQAEAPHRELPGEGGDLPASGAGEGEGGDPTQQHQGEDCVPGLIFCPQLVSPGPVK